MNRLLHLAVGALLLQWSISSTSAAFTSFHVFGDSLSCTATNPGAGSLYYGKRYSNGRVWVEVLASMLSTNQNFFNPSNNPHSFFGNSSTNLFAQTSAYVPPIDASNTLVVIWVNNADFYDPVLNDAPNTGAWLTLINIATNSHFRAITNLYGKGIRTLIMPNVVDISTVPFNQDTSKTNYIRQQCVAYNIAFSNTLNRAQSLYPDLIIYRPDFFTLLGDMLKQPATYGLTNLNIGGLNISAVSANGYGYPSASTNGYGTNYIFWDDTDPTAKVHYTMAGVVNTMLSPPLITSITFVNDSNRLDLANLPMATAKASNCFVLFATNLNQSVWQTNLPGFSSLTTTQSVYVPSGGQQRFYRLKSKLDFSWPWVWP